MQGYVEGRQREESAMRQLGRLEHESGLEDVS
jgi:hypothetical protein